MSQRIHTEAGTVLKDISSTSSKNLRNLTKYIFKKICLFTPFATEVKLIAFKFVSLQAVYNRDQFYFIFKSIGGR